LVVSAAERRPVEIDLQLGLGAEVDVARGEDAIREHLAVAGEGGGAGYSFGGSGSRSGNGSDERNGDGAMSRRLLIPGD